VWGSLFTIESFGVAANHPPSGAQSGDVEVSAVSTDYPRTVTLHARPRLPEPLTTRNTGLTESLLLSWRSCGRFALVLLLLRELRLPSHHR
jgi:hypothetical protein